MPERFEVWVTGALLDTKIESEGETLQSYTGTWEREGAVLPRSAETAQIKTRRAKVLLALMLVSFPLLTSHGCEFIIDFV